MNKHQTIDQLKNTYRVLEVVDLSDWTTVPIYQRKDWIRKILNPLYRSVYENNDRLVFVIDSRPGPEIVDQLQRCLNEIDISNYFVIVLSDDPMLEQYYTENTLPISADSVPIMFHCFDRTGWKKPNYDYNSVNPLKISLDDLSAQEESLLTKSQVFCMYPWVHLHAYPTGEALPCCMADMDYPVGNCKENTLREIWNQEPMKDIRRRMLNEQPVNACMRCYEQESAGFLSGRQNANKHHGHHIKRIHETKPDGTFERFEMIHWDVRFSNLCNLKCRSCGYIFSSQWYQDQIKISGPEWGKNKKAIFYAGKTETDAFDQLFEHLDYVEHIYFAGGEPLIMEEHYKILDELERRERFDVRLVYNTNFTQIKLKDRVVFDYWKKFDSVSVGASLDAMGPRAEYIRKGTVWDTVERNRQQMMEICPRVDFYISPTLSIMNAWHLPDFHRDWVDRGLIRAQDLHVNLLQNPPHYRIDIAPENYKQKLKEKYQTHLEWLRPQDHLRRATVGFESAINFLMAIDNSHMIPEFWKKTTQLDNIRQENILEILPEIQALQ